jgi:glucose-1-phosphatase
MTKTTIEAIIFDLGRVLVAIDDTLLVERLFKGLDTGDIQELARRTMSDPAMVEFNTGRIDPETFYDRMKQTYHWDIDFDTFKQLWCRIFYPMEGMEQLVTQLRGRSRLGLLSDTDPLHWNHIITTWPWIQVFEKPTLSYQLGVMKPNPSIYKTASINVNTPPQKCLYIDDLQDNVNGALEAGMQAVLFENISKLKNILNHYRVL